MSERTSGRAPARVQVDEIWWIPRHPRIPQEELGGHVGHVRHRLCFLMMSSTFEPFIINPVSGVGPHHILDQVVSCRVPSPFTFVLIHLTAGSKQTK